MKKLFVFIFLSWSFVIYAQTTIESFDNIAADTNYVWTSNVESAPSYQTVTTDSADKVEGAASLDVVTSIGALHQWGSYSQIQYRFPEGVTQDWSANDTLKIWIKVVKAPTLPENMLFRVTIIDQDAPGNATESYVMDNFVAIDAATDWYELKIPFYEISSPNDDVVPGDSGFVQVPSSWGGFTWNDHKFNKDKIVGWNIGFITSGWNPDANIPADSLELKLDGFVRSGAKAIPVIFFNGKAVPSIFGTPWAWGAGSSISVVEGAGDQGPLTNALKFVESSEWGGWGGWGVDMPPTNMVNSWAVDSLQVTIKAEAGGDDTLRVQFESANGKRGIKFNVIRDNSWHTYKFALRDMTFDDGSPNFDASAVIKWGMMENGHNSTGGQVDYLTNIWTGNPVFDVISPLPPTGLSAIQGTYQNLITWEDVPGEVGETYSVYSADAPITDVTTADAVKLNVAHGEKSATQILRAALTDQPITKYYAIVCKDAAGNISAPAFLNSPTVNNGKGVPTIAKTAPANFVADGSLSEWTNVPKIEIMTSNATGFAADNKPINGDADLSIKTAYIAVDQDNLYFAAEVTDDIYTWLPPPQNSYQNDCVDLFLGLFDANKAPAFSSYKRGATPHYHFRFDEKQILMEGGANLDSIYMNNGGANYFFAWTTFTNSYIIEAKIPFTVLANNRDSGDKDSLFVPVEGMKIPIDFSINDNDGGSTSSDGGREGILCYSPYNNDQSWGDPSRWLWTWIGAKMVVDPDGVENANVVETFNLAQNYPNPFNPSTKINYSLQNPELVTLRIFDVLGREVATLVNQYQSAGNHTVSFNASSLASGMYFYKLEAGSFQSIKKMMLLK
ncbi:MAG: sugar-binding protein [Ignavibacteriaceae bacterium]|jgi:hypothetical protein